MKKLDNFVNSLNVLIKADFELANEDEIYRTGVIGQFNLTFELAWKSLRDVLSAHGVEGTRTGSPREILQLGYTFGFLEDSAVWLVMLKKRNLAIHVYSEEEADELLLLIQDSFIPALVTLAETLKRKLEETGGDWS